MSTNIQWTDETWTIVVGCRHAGGPGCDNCYVKRMMENPFYDFDHPFEDVKPHEDRLDKPYHWRKARKVFTTSTGDLFVGDVPTEFILQVFGVIQDLPRHTFQVLTKRPQRMARLDLPWPANVWAGTSVENQDWAWRLDHLREIPQAAVRWVSVEPLLGPVSLDLTDIDWVVIGGESGPSIDRPIIEMDLDWARDVVRQARAAGVAVFVKQMGSRWATRHRREHGPFPRGLPGVRHGGVPEAWPEDLRIREFPSMPMGPPRR